MARFTLVQKRNPQLPEAPKKWYANPKLVSRLSLNAVCKLVTRHTTIAPTEVKSSIELLGEGLPDILCASNSANIGIGTLRLSYGSEGVDTIDEFNTSMMRHPKVVFTPTPEFMEAIRAGMSFEIDGVVENGFTYPSVEEYKKYKITDRT